MVLLAGQRLQLRLPRHPREEVAPIEYNYQTKEELIEAGQDFFARPGEQGGVSVFARDGDTILHTYSDYGPATDLLCGTELYLNLTPLGRQDADLWHHDRYSELRS